jgi:hypothetical protein
MQTDTLNISSAAAGQTTQPRARKSGTRKSPAKQSPAKSEASSKQSKVLAMLRAASGTTIAATMKATKWQQHSVRGFLSSVVRKKLRLNLTSKLNADGVRIYRVTGGVARAAVGKTGRKSS